MSDSFDDDRVSKRLREKVNLKQGDPREEYDFVDKLGEGYSFIASYF